jgi:hypothetical protein
MFIYNLIASFNYEGKAGKNMSRESKIFTESKANVSKRVKEYEAFGWELLSINGFDVSMSRETQNKVYADLVKFEYEYENLKEQQHALVVPIPPKPLKALIAFIGLVCFLLPGVLYIVFKILKKKKYNEDLAKYNAEFERLEQEIKKVCESSRSTFFSRLQ